MVKKEKYVDWLSVALPEIYVQNIHDYIQATKTCSSVAEYVRRAVDNQLREDLKRLK
jgi:Arc/MetJ-type ribon-helix-helix transcriptional regulator